MKGRVKEQQGIEYYTQLPYSILLHQVEDEGKKYWIAEVPELPGCRSHGATVEEAVSSVEEAKKDWILDSLEEGEQVPVPVDAESYSGKFVVRMSCSLHRALSRLAQSEKLSLNQLVVTILARDVGRLSVLNRVEDKVDNLLDRITDVLREQVTQFAIPFSMVARSYKAGQYPIVGKGSDTEAQATVDIPALLRGAASTAPSLEELRSYHYPRYARTATISFDTSIAKEIEARDAVESEQK